LCVFAGPKFDRLPPPRANLLGTSATRPITGKRLAYLRASRPGSRSSSRDTEALPKTRQRSWLCRRAHRLVRRPVRASALALARAVSHRLASRAHAARLLRRTFRRRAPGLRHALGLERQLLPGVQHHGMPAGARRVDSERQHAGALAVVLGLGDEPLHEHASASGQQTRRAGGLQVRPRWSAAWRGWLPARAPSGVR
jgi:hypothetical protein